MTSLERIRQQASDLGSDLIDQTQKEMIVQIINNTPLEKREQALALAVQLIRDNFSLADYLPGDHCMNNPDCTCAACTYPLS